MKNNEFFTVPAGLHPNTINLVARFASAMAEKLYAAEQKYGYSDGWANNDWMDECRAKLLEHVAKGDPRDVAAYCAFLWHHGESTTPPPASQERGGDREVLLYLMQQFDCETWECEQCGHSEDCKTMDSAEYLRSYLAASPPSSAAEASINSPEIDSKLIPDAAEQAKPMSIQQMFDVEQAQAGEDEDGDEYSQGICGDGAAILKNGVMLTIDEIVAELNGLRRLAGGVTDKYDELIYAVHSKYPNETRHETALRYIRERENSSGGAAMVAALGAK